jgi:hypothetical protein
LKEFQEKIDTGGDDHQAVETIIQRLEDLELLHQENVDYKNERKGYQAIQQDPFGFGAPDDCPNNINIERECQDGIEATQ